jgi:hypothetical protein
MEDDRQKQEQGHEDHDMTEMIEREKQQQKERQPTRQDQRQGGCERRNDQGHGRD